MCTPPHLVSVSLCLISIEPEDPERGSEHSSETFIFSQGVQTDFPAEFPTHGSMPGGCTKYLSTAFSSAGPDIRVGSAGLAVDSRLQFR